MQVFHGCDRMLGQLHKKQGRVATLGRNGRNPYLEKLPFGGFVNREAQYRPPFFSPYYKDHPKGTPNLQEP